MKLLTLALTLCSVMCVNAAWAVTDSAASTLDVYSVPGYIIDKNYTVDAGYEKVDITLYYADFFPEFTRLFFLIDAKGMVRNRVNETAYLPPDADEWTSAGLWEFGEKLTGLLKVEALGRILEDECQLEFEIHLTGTGPVLKKLDSVMGPDTFGDNQLKSELKDLGLCG